MKLNWDKSYELGIAWCDNDHKHIIDVINDLLDRIKNNTLNVTNDEIIEIEEYLLNHCKREEAFQKQINYPGFKEHQEAHQDLRDLYAKLQSNYDPETTTTENQVRIILMMKDWLFHHITTVDIKLANYVKEHGIMNENT